MQYISTRGKSPAISFQETVLAGLAPDGGLYVPEHFFSFSERTLQHLSVDSFKWVAGQVLNHFAPDMQMLFYAKKVYTSEKFCNRRDGGQWDDIVSIRKLFCATYHHQTYLVGLSNGPTLAFKDMALQLLGELMEVALEGTPLNILGATSGDTGSAAIYALKGRPGIKVFMLSAGNMTDFQKAQMYAVQDENVHNIQIEGDFDSAQAVVKAIFNDADFKQRYHLGAVNSINWARIAAQVVYYIFAYVQVQRQRGGYVDVAIPSGNFGNAYAAFVAKQLGVPIRHIIIATNENDVLHEFVQTGVYRRREKTQQTISPSMEIQVASNLERYVYALLGGDAKRVAMLYAQFADEGQFDLSAFLPAIEKSGLRSVMCSEYDCRLVMKQMYADHDIFIDPHTAVAMFAATYAQYTPGIPMLVMETAQPAKFEDVVFEATGQYPPRPKGFEGLLCAPQKVVKMPPDVERVKQYIQEHA